jgi:hypothetical protein
MPVYLDPCVGLLWDNIGLIAKKKAKQHGPHHPILEKPGKIPSKLPQNSRLLGKRMTVMMQTVST